MSRNLWSDPTPPEVLETEAEGRSGLTPFSDEYRYFGEPSRRSSRVAFVLTLLCPGLGSLYLGKLLQGVAICVTYIGALAMFILAWSHLKFFPILPLLVLFVGLSTFSVLLARDAAIRARRVGNRYVLRGVNHPVVYTGFALALFFLPLFGLAQFTTQRLMTLVWVETEAMFPTLLEGDLLLVDRTAYREAGPQAGEVVVIRQSSDGALRLGRIVGVPGDEIEVTDSLPIINGEPVSRAMLQPDNLASEEIHLASALPVNGPPGAVTYAEQVEDAQYLTAELPTEIGARFEPVRLGTDEYFVLHDNRTHFGDSRDTGPVMRGQIVGQPLHVAFSSSPEGVRWDRVAKRVQPQPM